MSLPTVPLTTLLSLPNEILALVVDYFHDSLSDAKAISLSCRTCRDVSLPLVFQHLSFECSRETVNFVALTEKSPSLVARTRSLAIHLDEMLSAEGHADGSTRLVFSWPRFPKCTVLRVSQDVMDSRTPLTLEDILWLTSMFPVLEEISLSSYISVTEDATSPLTSRADTGGVLSNLPTSLNRLTIHGAEVVCSRFADLADHMGRIFDICSPWLTAYHLHQTAWHPSRLLPATPYPYVLKFVWTDDLETQQFSPPPNLGLLFPNVTEIQVPWFVWSKQSTSFTHLQHLEVSTQVSTLRPYTELSMLRVHIEPGILLPALRCLVIRCELVLLPYVRDRFRIANARRRDILMEICKRREVSLSIIGFEESSPGAP